MDYLDFDIQIISNPGNTYLVSVRSPAGEASEYFTLPYSELELQVKLKDLELALRSSSRMRRIQASELQSVQDMGQDLFNALITGEIRSRFDVSQRMANEQRKGLRLRLRIHAPELGILPWEYLYDNRAGDYLCLSIHTPIVRNPELPKPILPLEVAKPLRVLGMICAPSDLAKLDIKQEKQRIETALAPLKRQGQIKLHWLEGSTWRDLHNEISRAERNGEGWHIFHLIGHGVFDERTDEGQVALVGEDGRADLRPATQLGRLLADQQSIRLVVLNICEGARGSALDAFSSVAATLVRRGPTAVVAMQNSISDLAAIELARTFYENLAEGAPVDSALGEARKAISMALPRTVEWGTPVLFMRSPDGILFRLPNERLHSGPTERPGPRKNLFLAKILSRLKSIFKQRRILAIILGVISVLTATTFVINLYVQPILPSTLNSKLLLAIAAITAFFASFKNGLDLFSKLFVLPKPLKESFQTPIEKKKASQPLLILPNLAGIRSAFLNWLKKFLDQVKNLFSHSIIKRWALAVLVLLCAILILWGGYSLVSSNPEWIPRIIAFFPSSTSTITPNPTIAVTPEPSQTSPNPPIIAGTPTNTQTPYTISLLTPSSMVTPLLEPTFGIGSTRISPKDNMVMVYVPAGEFLMGSKYADTHAQNNEKPQHSIYLDTFWIDQTEVTNAQYASCVEQGYCQKPEVVSSNTRPSYYDSPGFASYPVIHVSWQDAVDYCSWAGKRLPTEAEWEKAARGSSDTRIYPWGDASPTCRMANHGGTLCIDDTNAVGKYLSGASPYGAMDMAGNVWEWVNDWYQSNYYSDSPLNNPQGPASGTYRVLRGGSWYYSVSPLRVTNRNNSDPTNRNNNIGFRCAASSSKDLGEVDPTEMSNIPSTPAPTSTTTLGIGSTMISPKDAMVMMYVPEGEFTMGSNTGRTELYREEPQHVVYLDSFWIDQTEITNAQYSKCVEAGLCELPKNEFSATRNSYFGNPEFMDFPVIYVTFDDATKYCTWAGKRLPTEAEWEKAARGAEGLIYPWGDEEPDCTLTNFYDSSEKQVCEGDTSKVGSYQKDSSPYGVFDMAGNVQEWINDRFNGYYYSYSPGRNPLGPEDGIPRVNRGGKWNTGGDLTRTAWRSYSYPGDYREDLGFRCAVSP